MAKREDSEKIVINVGGVRHETYKSCLMARPGTRLALLAESVSSDDVEPGSIREFFYDRDPGMFTYILNYYRTGSLNFPPNACGCLFEKELAFWGINETAMEPCCWVSYSTHRDKIEALRKLWPPDPEQPDRHSLILLNPEGREATWRSKIWALFDDPYSSKAAEVIAVLSLIFILVSIINTCVGTHPFFEGFLVDAVDAAVTPDYAVENDIEEPRPSNVFFVVEAVCVAWFTFEFLVRVICCPDKLLYISNPLNMIDFVAIVPFYLEVRPKVLSSTFRGILGMVRVVRYLRLLRVFKMMRDVVCVQVLGHTLRASLSYFFIVSASLAVASFMFGSLLFYGEKYFGEHHIGHIPSGAWWAVISLSTIGYGDIYPETWIGKLVGGLCAVTGVLTLALPAPALVNNFRIYHKLVTAKRKLSMKKRYNPALNVPVASTSGNSDHPQSFGCPLVTESIH